MSLRKIASFNQISMECDYLAEARGHIREGRNGRDDGKPQMHTHCTLAHTGHKSNIRDKAECKRGKHVLLLLPLPVKRVTMHAMPGVQPC